MFPRARPEDEPVHSRCHVREGSLPRLEPRECRLGAVKRFFCEFLPQPRRDGGVSCHSAPRDQADCLVPQRHERFGVPAADTNIESVPIGSNNTAHVALLAGGPRGPRRALVTRMSDTKPCDALCSREWEKGGQGSQEVGAPSSVFGTSNKEHLRLCHKRTSAPFWLRVF